jgi:hypothetical protein
VTSGFWILDRHEGIVAFTFEPPLGPNVIPGTHFRIPYKEFTLKTPQDTAGGSRIWGRVIHFKIYGTVKFKDFSNLKNVTVNFKDFFQIRVRTACTPPPGPEGYRLFSVVF